jgi:hypothetical protein
MTAEIRKLIHATPFVPFSIHLADGGQIRVPTVDHIAAPPPGTRVMVFHDDGSWEWLSSLLISRLSIDRESVSDAR